MNKPIIVLKTASKAFSKVYALALTVYDNMHLNPNFINPQPNLSVVKSDYELLAELIGTWGEVGNRGSHQDHVHLVNQSQLVHTRLAQLASWCMSSVDAAMPYPEQTVILNSSGFPLKNAKTPQGRLEMVVDFHRFISRTVRQEQVKMRWKKPLGVTTHTNVKSYVVFRNTTNDFANASVIATVPNTTYTDDPGMGFWYYWVVAVNNQGYGVTSHVVTAKVA